MIEEIQRKQFYFIFSFIEVMTQCAVTLGFSQEMAEKIAMQTYLGSIQYWVDSDKSLSELIKAVSSPNGTTEAGLKVLRDGRLNQLINEFWDLI